MDEEQYDGDDNDNDIAKEKGGKADAEETEATGCESLEVDKAKRQKEFEEMHEKTKKQEETRAMQDEGYTLVASKRKSRRRRKEFCRGYKEGKAGQDVCKEGCACEAGKVSTLRAVAPENIKNLDEAPEWEEIEVALDSGATESVCADDMLTNVETVEGDAQRKGVQYEVASESQTDFP